jgi:prolyl 4-hydroxylase
MTFSIFQLGCLFQLFIYSSHGGEVVEDRATARTSCHMHPLEDGVELDWKSFSNLINETCLLEDFASASYEEEEEEDIGISESSYKVGAPASRVPDELGSDMGESQTLDSELTSEILDRIAKARVYMEMVALDDKYEKVKGICKNSHTSCAFWAVLGECKDNAGYMTVNCAPVCESCEQLHVETRCPMDPDAIDALYPGDLDTMFQEIITNPDFQQYEPKVLSRPDYTPGDTAETADYQLGPWLVVFDNAMSGEEADRLVELGGITGYELSADVGDKKEDGTYTAQTNSGRTSTNAWCIDDCYADPTARVVMDRIANITYTPEMNSEYLQLLRYEEGQFYQIHNDYIPYQRQRPQGVRILTFYFYLNDLEEKDGGGTHFPKLNLTVTPRKGRAVLWPSILSKSPNRKDTRTDHQAMPVLSGVKYGANAWIHQRDYKTPNRKGCQ